MAASDVRAGRAYVEVTVKDNLTAGLSKSLAKLRAFATAVNSVGSTLRKMGDSIADAGKKITGVGQDFLKFGGVVSGALLLVSKVAASYGSLINNASQRTGVGAEKLQALAYAAGLVDVRFESLEINIRRMQKSIAGLAKGGGEAAGAFETLGITLSDVAGLAPEEQLKVIADRMNKITDPTLKASLALSIFGRSGTEMIPLLNTGADGIAKMMKRADELGIVLGRKDVTLLDAFDDALLEVFTQLKALTYQIGAAIAEAVQPFVGSVQKAIKAAIDWVKNNRGLFVSLVKLAAIAGAAALGIGVLLVTLGKTIVVVGTALKVFGGLVSAVAVLLSPLGLAVVAVTALAGAFLYFTGIGSKVVQFLSVHFKGALADILTALKSGSLENAFAIMWEHIKIIWLDGSKSLLQVMDDLGFDMSAKLKSTADKIAAARKKIDQLKGRSSTSGGAGGGSSGSQGDGDIDIGDLAKSASRLQFGGVNAELALGGAGGPLEETAKNTGTIAEMMRGLPGALAAAIRGPARTAKEAFDYWGGGTRGAERSGRGIATDSRLQQLRDAVNNPANPNDKKVLTDQLARAEREFADARATILGEGDPKRHYFDLWASEMAKKEIPGNEAAIEKRKRALFGGIDFLFQPGIGSDLIKGSALNNGTSTSESAKKLDEISDNTERTAGALRDIARRMGNGLAFT